MVSNRVKMAQHIIELRGGALKLMVRLRRRVTYFADLKHVLKCQAESLSTEGNIFNSLTQINHALARERDTYERTVERRKISPPPPSRLS